MNAEGDLLDCAKLDIGPTEFALQETHLENFLAEAINDFKTENAQAAAEIDLRLEYDSVIPPKVYIDQDKTHYTVYLSSRTEHHTQSFCPT